MVGVTLPVRVGEIELLVETVPVAGTQATSAASRVTDAVGQARDAFARAQSAIVEVATSTMQVIEEAGRRAARPDAMEVEFGLKFSANGNVIMAGASGEATLAVRLTYNRAAAALPGGHTGQEPGPGGDGGAAPNPADA
ncbi:hypothetical protein ACE1SV_71800 [Streptomyces sp. E-15]